MRPPPRSHSYPSVSISRSLASGPRAMISSRACAQKSSTGCGVPGESPNCVDRNTSTIRQAISGATSISPMHRMLESLCSRQAVAVNLNECESSPLALAEDDDYEHRLCGEECDVAVAAMPVGIPTRGKNIWCLVIVIAGVFMTAEIVLANRTAL